MLLLKLCFRFWFASLITSQIYFLDDTYQAYSWGFDIRSWQRNLNPMTWPEILRQFALSAGFGPQLKKRNFVPAFFRDDDEVSFFYASLVSLLNLAYFFVNQL